MDLAALLRDVASGAMSVSDAMKRLTNAPYEDLGYARVDHHRVLVQGAAEVVYGEGKTPEQVVGVVRALVEQGAVALVTRASPELAVLVRAQFPSAQVEHHESARVVVVRGPAAGDAAAPRIGTAALVAAGTSDLPVVDECDVCCRAWGIATTRFVDVGVAGIHRILAVREQIDQNDVVIVVAGMEGALASVAAGLTKKPVIAVPTSVGYGAHFGGIAPLLSMLNACSSGITVVNIDNGFGAAAAARRMLASRRA